jgi:hypothetical protein
MRRAGVRGPVPPRRRAHEGRLSERALVLVRSACRSRRPMLRPRSTRRTARLSRPASRRAYP